MLTKFCIKVVGATSSEGFYLSGWVIERARLDFAESFRIAYYRRLGVV